MSIGPTTLPHAELNSALGSLCGPKSNSPEDYGQDESMKRKPLRTKMWATAFLHVAITLGVPAISGCKNFFIPPSLTTVTVSPSTPTVAVAGTQQMIATGTYEDGVTDTITDSVSWSSSDASIATINSTGLVTGIATGSATISATLDGVTGSTTVTVASSNLASIEITSTTTSISSGDTAQFTATGILQNGDTSDMTDSVTWNSSNTTAATINSSGLATAQSVSSTETTAITATSGSVTSNSITLTVSQ
jgi:trimeric autotransporter adhesin